MKSLQDLKSYANSNEEGFTLIELMIVVVIIGILAAIAIPIFANQQKAAIDASVKTDVRNTVLAVETYFTKNISSPSISAAWLQANVAPSAGNQIEVWGNKNGYCVVGINVKGELYNLQPSGSAYLLYSNSEGYTKKNRSLLQGCSDPAFRINILAEDIK